MLFEKKNIQYIKYSNIRSKPPKPKQMSFLKKSYSIVRFQKKLFFLLTMGVIPVNEK